MIALKCLVKIIVKNIVNIKCKMKAFLKKVDYLFIGMVNYQNDMTKKITISSNSLSV